MNKKQLQIAYGQASQSGRKPINQDFHGLFIPEDYHLESKGIAIGLADGISSSQVSQIASETVIKNFLQDYYSTPESWPVKKSAVQVLNAINSWLHAMTRRSHNRYNLNKGYVTTFSGIILKAHKAHIFHCGDSRVYRLEGEKLLQLTEDHRSWISEEQGFLNRAMGFKDVLNLDYREINISLEELFVLTTDGIYEWISEAEMVTIIQKSTNDLQLAADTILQAAYDAGSNDNLSIQIIKITQLPEYQLTEIKQQLDDLPLSQQLSSKRNFDGFQILREIAVNSRSYVYLAKDLDTEKEIILKLPAAEHHNDPDFLERFLMEEWIARRLNHPNLLKSFPPQRKRHYIYTVSEYIEGQTLHQWILDHGKSDLATMRNIIDQIAQGLYALHRMEILHRDVRPHNVMIDQHGAITLLDFGSVKIPGIAEIKDPNEKEKNLGTAQYSAPEFFLGHTGGRYSDQFSLAVIAYQLLSGKLPYGTEVAKASTRADQLKLKYRSLLLDNPEIPLWIDETLKKALNPNPQRRYKEISEFIYDLNHPKANFSQTAPLIERHPVRFWQGVSLILFLMVIGLLTQIHNAS